MAINLKDILDYVTPEPRYTGELKNLGLITSGDLEKARNQSIVQGLLGAGLSYLAQTKTMGYGSAIPYLAKAGIAGLQASERPYERLKEDVLMKSKLEEFAQQRIKTEKEKQLTDSLLNDPRVKGNPLYENLAYKDPIKLTEVLNPKQESLFSKANVGDFTEESIAKALQAKKSGATDDEAKAFLQTKIKEQSFKDLYGAPQKDSRYGLVYFPNNPKFPVLDAKGNPILDYKPEPKEVQESVPSIPTDVSIKNTKNRLNAAHGFDLNIEKEDDKTVAMAVNSRANQIMATQKVSFDDAIDMAVAEFEAQGAISEEKPWYEFLPFVSSESIKEIKPKSTIKKPEWKIELKNKKG